MFFNTAGIQSLSYDAGTMASQFAQGAMGIAMPGLAAAKPVYSFVAESVRNSGLGDMLDKAREGLSAGLDTAGHVAADVTRGVANSFVPGGAVVNAVESMRSASAQQNVPDVSSTFEQAQAGVQTLAMHHVLDAGKSAASDYESACEKLYAAPTQEGSEHAVRQGMLQGLVDLGYDPSTKEGRADISAVLETARERDMDGYRDALGNASMADGESRATFDKISERDKGYDELSSLMDDLDSGKVSMDDFDLQKDSFTGGIGVGSPAMPGVAHGPGNSGSENLPRPADIGIGVGDRPSPMFEGSPIDNSDFRGIALGDNSHDRDMRERGMGGIMGGEVSGGDLSGIFEGKGPKIFDDGGLHGASTWQPGPLSDGGIAEPKSGPGKFDRLTDGGIAGRRGPSQGDFDMSSVLDGAMSGSSGADLSGVVAMMEGALSGSKAASGLAASFVDDDLSMS